jgi:hypothetical protein
VFNFVQDHGYYAGLSRDIRGRQEYMGYL